jgi:hypothetical protein
LPCSLVSSKRGSPLGRNVPFASAVGSLSTSQVLVTQKWCQYSRCYGHRERACADACHRPVSMGARLQYVGVSFIRRIKPPQRFALVHQRILYLVQKDVFIQYHTILLFFQEHPSCLRKLFHQDYTAIICLTKDEELIFIFSDIKMAVITSSQVEKTSIKQRW